jgi:uncharacterized protein YceH (UPF0502 family)
MDEVDRQIETLKQRLEILREQMPETPLDAERKAMEVGLLEEQLAELYELKGDDIPAQAQETNCDLDELTEQIRSITDELMELEIRMIKAEMNGDDSEKVKLQLSANALKDRRQTLIDEVRAMNDSPKPQEKSELETRVEALEKEVADIKTLLYQLLTR